ncbi:MAG: hypothetical protein JWP97_5072 [Labilithrix sp.]|nr:hypothetical protein [Labilithrix sp.]
MADPKAHKRYLDYRERHVYFGRAERLLGMEEYITLDVELDALMAKGEDGRDDEEEQRFDELAKLLFRD